MADPFPISYLGQVYNRAKERGLSDRAALLDLAARYPLSTPEQRAAAQQTYEYGTRTTQALNRMHERAIAGSAPYTARLETAYIGFVPSSEQVQIHLQVTMQHPQGQLDTQDIYVDHTWSDPLTSLLADAQALVAERSQRGTGWTLYGWQVLGSTRFQP